VQQRRGCGLLTWVVILVVVLAVAAYLIHRAQVEEFKRQQAEQVQRRAVRATQLDQVGNSLAQALEAVQAGDIASALLIIESQEKILASIAQEAASSQDAEDASDAVDKKGALAQVRTAIRQKQEEMKAFAVQELLGLATEFPQVKSAAAAKTGEGQQSATESGATAPTPGAAESAPGGGAETSAAPVGEPLAPAPAAGP